MKDLIYAVLFTYLFCSFYPFRYTNKSLEPYVKEVKNLIMDNCKQIGYVNPEKQKIYFNKLMGYEVGACTYNRLVHNQFKIEIDRDEWKVLTEDERFQLMAHELSHCMLLFEHSNNPKDYMYAYMNTLSKQEVIDQLKKRCNP